MRCEERGLGEAKRDGGQIDAEIEWRNEGRNLKAKGKSKKT